jgi:uridine kinase
MNSKKTFVIAIAAVSGGGKTFITEKINKQFSSCKALYFDDYDFEGPESICQWVEKGSNYNVWNLQPLIKDIEMIINDQENHIDLLILDYPFAKKHDLMNTYIDYTFFIDTPLDIALSRRILRDFKKHSIDELESELTDYMLNSRKAYLDMLKRIKPNSDYRIDGSLETEPMVKEIVNELIRLKPQLEKLKPVQGSIGR